MAGLGFWMMRRGEAPLTEAVAAAETPSPPEAKPVSAAPGLRAAPAEPARSDGNENRLREIEALNEKLDAERRRETELLAEQRAAFEQRGGVYFPTDGELLQGEVGSEVLLEGVLDHLEKSNSGKTIYLIFTGGTGPTAPRSRQ
ncbi:MAG: hypothetical protein R2843_15110 [Thermomicrobiales bacterium]